MSNYPQIPHRLIGQIFPTPELKYKYKYKDGQKCKNLMSSNNAGSLLNNICTVF